MRMGRTAGTRLVAGAVVTAALVLGACGDDDGGGDGTGADVTAGELREPATTTTTRADGADTGGSTTSAPEPAGPGAGTGPVAGGPDAPPTGTILLSDVRVGREGGVERVVFELLGDQAPTYEVAYADSPLYTAGEGTEVRVAGEAVLAVALSPVSPARIEGEVVEPTYTGPDRLPGTGGLIQEAVQFGAFEARLEWAVGLERTVPFSVSVLSDPTRVVVELDTTG